MLEGKESERKRKLISSHFKPFQRKKKTGFENSKVKNRETSSFNVHAVHFSCNILYALCVANQFHVPV
jgi:hypothetical protein